MREWLESLLEPQVPLILIVLLRLFVGYEFFIQGNDKMRQGYFEKVDNKEVLHPLTVRLKVWIEEERKVKAHGVGDVLAGRAVRMFKWYRFFLENAVLPNVWAFGVLVTGTELALGVLLVLGLLTRVASVAGLLLLINYLLATWHYGFPYTPLNILFLVLLAVFLLVGAGRCLGLDSLLHNRFPEVPIF